MEGKAILFHSNLKDRCYDFITGKEDLIISYNDKDDVWLGSGMYFWDTQGNVSWWNKMQKKRNPQKEYEIVQVNANIENILDLTDDLVCHKTQEYWIELCSRLKCNSNIPLGQKLNTLFEISGWKKKYECIKVMGKYNNIRNYSGLFEYDIKSYKAEPTMATKCIYNIKSPSCIIEKCIYEEGLDYDERRKYTIHR